MFAGKRRVRNTQTSEHNNRRRREEEERKNYSQVFLLEKKNHFLESEVCYWVIVQFTKLATTGGGWGRESCLGVTFK